MLVAINTEKLEGKRAVIARDSSKLSVDRAACPISDWEADRWIEIFKMDNYPSSVSKALIAPS